MTNIFEGISTETLILMYKNPSTLKEEIKRRENINIKYSVGQCFIGIDHPNVYKLYKITHNVECVEGLPYIVECLFVNQYTFGIYSNEYKCIDFVEGEKLTEITPDFYESIRSQIDDHEKTVRDMENSLISSLFKQLEERQKLTN